MRRAVGFTLLEVLVALAVLAIAMGAIIHATTQSIANTAELRDQTFAGWVALNQINQLLLDRNPWPAEGVRKGNADLANRTWHWEARFAKTDDPDLRRLEVSVRATENAPALSTLVAFRANPPSDRSSADGSAKNPSARNPSARNPSARNPSRTSPP
jgi:general secretion pathway protein I